MVVPIEMSVPRKGDQFQADIFPDTRAYAPSLTAAEWYAGGNANPKTVSMKPGADGGSGQASPVLMTMTSPAAALEAENAALKARVAELEAELAQLKTK